MNTGLLDNTLARVKAEGERLTLQRRLVIEALCERNGHFTINDIQQFIHKHYASQILSEATIYRILHWLKDLELVSQTDTGAEGIVYELLIRRHHHLICLTCGRMMELDDAWMSQLRERLNTEYGFHARIEHMAIYGHCQTCFPRQHTLE